MRFPNALGLVLFGTIGCRAVQQVRPTEYIPRHSPDLVWVSFKDAVIPVVHPHIDGDTLRGTDLDSSVAIPIGSIQSVRARAPAPDRTTLIIAALVAGGIYVARGGGLSAGGAVYYPPDGDCHCVLGSVEGPRP